MTPPQPLGRALSPAAAIIALLALVLAGAGVGYTAGKVDTKDLANNAVTSAKVKNGSLKAADLVKDAKLKRPELGDGGQNDCLWTSAEEQIPGLSPVGYRTDRFGTTHLSGIALLEDGPGGDAMCGGPGEAVEDGTIFTLPKKARPDASLFLPGGTTESTLLIAGPGGLDLGGGVFLPFGTVACSTSSGGGCWLEGTSFPTRSAKVAPRAPHGSKAITPRGRELLKGLFAR